MAHCCSESAAKHDGDSMRVSGTEASPTATHQEVGWSGVGVASLDGCSCGNCTHTFLPRVVVGSALVAIQSLALSLYLLLFLIPLCSLPTPSSVYVECPHMVGHVETIIRDYENYENEETGSP